MKTTWTPPPEMPSGLTPLPVGKNGRPLVYVADLAKNFSGYCLQWFQGKWGEWRYDEEWRGDKGCHYAVESDSEFCRLNQWGDYTPPAKPAEPAAPLSAVARHLAQMRKEADDAEKDFKDADKAFDDALAWRSQKLAAFNDKLEVIAKLEGADDALSRQKWMEHGMKIQRLHLKKPTVFTKYP